MSFPKQMVCTRAIGRGYCRCEKCSAREDKAMSDANKTPCAECGWPDSEEGIPTRYECEVCRRVLYVPAREQTTVARVRVDGKMEYAMGISKEDAVWLKEFLSPYLGPRSIRIQKRCVWVIAQADKGMDEHL